jgi:hypothetical protein
MARPSAIDQAQQRRCALRHRMANAPKVPRFAFNV